MTRVIACRVWDEVARRLHFPKMNFSTFLHFNEVETADGSVWEVTDGPNKLGHVARQMNYLVTMDNLFGEGGAVTFAFDYDGERVFGTVTVKDWDRA